MSYWQKYVTGAPAAPERSDQRVLREIAAWRSGDKSGLVARIMDDELSDQIEAFVRQFTPDDCLRFLRETVDEVAMQSADQWPSLEHPPGIIPTRRMMLRCRPDSKKLLADLEGFLRKLVPCHLSLAHVIESFFAGPKTDPVPELLPDEARNTLVELKHELLRTSFPPGSSAKLIEAVKGGYPWTFYWFCIGRGGIGLSDTVALPFDGWEGFATTMLEAAEACPTVGVPLLVPFVTSGKHEMRSRQSGHGTPDRGTEFVAQFEEDLARRLFQFDRLVPILAENEVSYPEYEPLDRQIKEARRACLAILARPHIESHQ